MIAYLPLNRKGLSLYSLRREPVAVVSRSLPGLGAAEERGDPAGMVALPVERQHSTRETMAGEAPTLTHAAPHARIVLECGCTGAVGAGALEDGSD
jgi:hypothetical protein